jgi:hypothetical protein
MFDDNFDIMSAIPAVRQSPKGKSETRIRNRADSVTAKVSRRLNAIKRYNDYGTPDVIRKFGFMDNGNSGYWATIDSNLYPTPSR